jgi:P-type E1-E2 ATPase
LIDKGYHYQYLLNKGNGQVSQDHSTICRVRDSSLTTSFVAIDKQIIGAILFEDTLRDEAKEAVARIKAMGITVIMLTGDNEKIAKRLADEANIDEYRASLLPQDKVSEIEKIVNRQKNEHNKRVVMVGDGINDAPALAKADVGIAMGKTGTDVAVETADVILMTENLLKIPDLINASRHTLSAIQQNFFGTLFVDGIGFVLAMTGYLNPLLAAIIHVVSELVFMVNSARLLVDSSGFYKHS